jgi:RNase P/RNase MRP subunit POP5
LRSKKRYVIVRLKSNLLQTESPKDILKGWIQALYGIYGLSRIHLKEVYSDERSIYIYSINADAKDLFRSIFILDDNNLFRIIRVTGTLRKAKRIVSSLPGLEAKQ